MRTFSGVKKSAEEVLVSRIGEGYKSRYPEIYSSICLGAASVHVHKRMSRGASVRDATLVAAGSRLVVAGSRWCAFFEFHHCGIVSACATMTGGVPFFLLCRYIYIGFIQIGRAHV